MSTRSKRIARRVLLATSLVPVGYLRGMARYAQEHAWHLVTDMMFSGLLPQGGNPDGILVGQLWPPEPRATLEYAGVPRVTFMDRGARAGAARVEVDRGQVGRMAADHLLDRGHRSFVWAPFVHDEANDELFAAFAARLMEHGCHCRALPPMHVRVGAAWQDNSAERRRVCAEELKRLPHPSAVFASDDCAAADMVAICQEAGLAVPEDIAVLGVGNSVLCETSPVPLSSIDANLEEIGYAAAALLDELMSGRGDAARVVQVAPNGVNVRLSTNVAAVKNPRVARALIHIAEHYPNSMLSVGDVAEAVGTSRRNLERSFRDETGCSINEYIVRVRMREASRLLMTHARARSSDIAALVGLAGAGTFFRTFRRYFGTTPGQYREHVARGQVAALARVSRLRADSDGTPNLLEPLAGVRSTAA